MKRIVICCDGTWNTSDQEAYGVPVPTNVARLYNAVPPKVRPSDQDNTVTSVLQHRYYHPGVGTEHGPIQQMLGGAIGLGLGRNVRSAYRELCDYYQAGDEIFLFGFSRGAYTARSLAGMIAACGLLDLRAVTSDDERWARIRTAFDQGYRKHQRNYAQSRGWPLLPVPEDCPAVPIRFVGVWDTVGAIGIPDSMGLLRWLSRSSQYAFHNTTLGASIQTARHALAIDEKRMAFQPTLWTDLAPDRDVQQVWFPGVHSDVGGGYKEHGLSDGALKWMITEAETAGLVFDQAMLSQIAPNPQDVAHRSAKGFFGTMPTMPRAVPFLDAPSLRHQTGQEQVATSSLIRQATPPIFQAPYWTPSAVLGTTPHSFDVFADQAWNTTGLFLQAGVTYEAQAEGQWLDRDVHCSPDGPLGWGLSFGRLRQWLCAIPTAVQTLVRTITKNPLSRVFFARRHHQQSWLYLYGAIANGGIDGTQLRPHQTLALGAGPTQFTPEQDGYFYAYGNDSWLGYGNNQGRLRLTLRRVTPEDHQTQAADIPSQ